MKKLHKILLGTVVFGLFTANMALATPSTQIWIPSTDIQKFGTFHLGLDNYVRNTQDTADGERLHIYDFGLTTGVLPFEKVQMEAGVDFIYNGTDADDRPLYFNAKIGTPEGSMFEGSPALAAGGFSFGTDGELTDYNIVYGLVAKTLPVVGRISAGYYTGNADLLVDEDGDEDNDGILLSWDRTMSEISDKLWAAVDYQGGNNSFGALSFGVAWAFSPNVSVIVGYDIFNERKIAGKNTFTTQLDVNF